MLHACILAPPKPKKVANARIFYQLLVLLGVNDADFQTETEHSRLGNQLLRLYNASDAHIGYWTNMGKQREPG